MHHLYFAQTEYGITEYGCGEYSTGEGCQTTSGSPLAPITGFLEQSPLIVLPTLLLIAIFIGSIAYVISRKFRKKSE